MARRSESRPTVEIPRREDDHPAWTRVGIIAAIGFVIGVAWPKLTQTRLAPRPPTVSAPAPKASAKPPAATPPARMPAAATSAAPSALPVASTAKAEKAAPSAKAELATIVVKAANVREEPKSKNVTGKLVEGAKVQILERSGSWFRVRYGKEMNREGWIFREAIGR